MSIRKNVFFFVFQFFLGEDPIYRILFRCVFLDIHFRRGLGTKLKTLR